MSTPRFIVRPGVLQGDRALISGAELHHLRVRRVRVGSAIVLTDGHGIERHGVVTELGREGAVVSLAPQREINRESSLRLTLAQSVLKGDKMDLVVEKATELGIAELLVFTSERSLGTISPDRRARWERVAASAAKQAQRCVIPAVIAAASAQAVFRHPADLRLLFWEGAGPGSPPLSAITSSVLAVVGPEGGFSAYEAEHAVTSGLIPVTLGPRILRAETAAVVAVTLCQYRWGDLGKPP